MPVATLPGHQIREYAVGRHAALPADREVVVGHLEKPNAGRLIVVADRHIIGHVILSCLLDDESRVDEDANE